MEISVKDVQKSLESIIRKLPNGIIIIDKEGVVLFCNPATEQIFGRSAQKLLGSTLGIPIKTGKRLEIDTISKGEGRSVAEMHVEEISWEGAAACLVSLFDITERVRLEEKLQKLATKDELTQAYNRAIFEELLNKEIERFKRYNQPFSLVLLDIDFFKKINDTYGHDTGDDVLRSISSIFRDSIRGMDSLIRWGGEEFMVIAPETDLENARLLAERLRKIIDNYWFDRAGPLKISLGVASFKKDDTQYSIVKRADEALYVAKRNGRNRVEIST